MKAFCEILPYRADLTQYDKNTNDLKVLFKSGPIFDAPAAKPISLIKCQYNKLDAILPKINKISGIS